MTRSSTFIFIFVAIFAFCFITSTVAQAAPAAEFQQDELIQFLNSRYPNLYNRALRSMGKPTFIRFGKRSGSSSMVHQQPQQPQYPFEQLQQQQQWSQ